MIVEADLKLIENAFAPKEIEANSKSLRKSNWGSNFPFMDLDGEIVKICRYETSVANDNHLLPTPFLVYSDSMCIVCAQDSKGRSRISKYPHSMTQNGNRDYWHQVTFMEGVGEFYKRHAISSSRGTRSTDCTVSRHTLQIFKFDRDPLEWDLLNSGLP